MEIRRAISSLKGIFPLVYVTGNLCLWLVPLIVLAFLKIIIPFHKLQDAITALMVGIYRVAVWCDDFLFFQVMGITLDVSGMRNIYPNKFYIIIANHQSWNDIFILQHIFNWRAPVLKFLVKRELIYLPIVGLICLAYNYPFLKRSSVKGRTEKDGNASRDAAILERALIRFSRYPASVINLVEGTRFSPKKAAQQKSPYNNLLKPKAGGLSTMLNFLGDQVSVIVDVTIVYGCERPTFWNFLCGRCPRIVVRIHEHSAREIGREYQAVAKWISEVWDKKDLEIDAVQQGLKKGHGHDSQV